MRAVRDITGLRSGTLVAVRLHKTRVDGKSTRAFWECMCDCGNTTFVRGVQIVNGSVKSCGCTRGKSNVTHGHSSRVKRTPTYMTWFSMCARCNYTHNISYRFYGAKGIRVCEKWLNSFESFLQDMGERPTGKTLDRIDGNGNYEPSNCRWATPKEQAQNRKVRTNYGKAILK